VAVKGKRKSCVYDDVEPRKASPRREAYKIWLDTQHVNGLDFVERSERSEHKTLALTNPCGS
jgi:hypothetical protein